MANIEENKQAVVAFADAFSRGDWDRLRSLCTEDFQWVWPVSKTMQSPQLRAQEIALAGADRSLSEMIDILEMTKRTSRDGRFDLKVIEMTAEGDRVAAEAEGHAICDATGRVYNNYYLYMMYFRQGKIRLFKEYQDTLHAYDVWMAP